MERLFDVPKVRDGEFERTASKLLQRIDEAIGPDPMSTPVSPSEEGAKPVQLGHHLRQIFVRKASELKS